MSINSPLPITIVSGLPRSGTSLMMQILEAGGLPPLTDRVRTADQNNPRGYYELEAVKKTREDATWLNNAAGKCVKVVSLLLYDLPMDRPYNVIF
ncbi:MAG: sulfotransferase family protein, partial [bacterium]